MVRIKIGYSLLLMTGTLIGCDNSQIGGLTEKATQKADSAGIVANVNKTSDKILFKGDNMTLIESDLMEFKPLHFDHGKKSCLNRADENIKKKLSALGFNADTKYFEFEAVEKNSFGSDKFILNFDKVQFSNLSSDSLKKLDKYIGFTDSRKLYFIKNKNISYLLLIGHDSSTSGMGHNYRTHLLIPLNPNRPPIDFNSISEDPRRIRIDDSGTIYYVQIDPPYFGAIKDGAAKSIDLTVSLFTVDSMSNQKVETKFNFACENLDNVFDEK